MTSPGTKRERAMNRVREIRQKMTLQFLTAFEFSIAIRARVSFLHRASLFFGVSIGHGDRQPRQVSTYILADMVWWLGRHGRVELRNLTSLLRNRR
jgi:hypothetical protein